MLRIFLILFYLSQIFYQTIQLNNRIITSIAFPALSTDDSQPNSPPPCFLFQGNIEFLITYEDNGRAKLITIEVPKDSLVSGNCSIANNFVSVSGVFTSTNITHKSEQISLSQSEEPFLAVTCGLSINFSKSSSPSNHTFYSQFDEMKVTCNIGNKNNVSAFYNKSFIMTPIGYSFSCGRNGDDGLTTRNDANEVFSLAPDFDMVLRSFRIEVFPNLPSPNAADIKTGNTTNGTRSFEQDKDPWDKYFGPAIHCDNDMTPATPTTAISNEISTNVDSSRTFDNLIKPAQLAAKLVVPASENSSDLKVIYDVNDKDDDLKIRPEYEKENPDWREHLRTQTSTMITVPTDDDTTNTTVTPSNITTTTDSPTTSITSISTPASTPTPTPIPTPSPVTIKPDTVPQALQAMVFYKDNSNATIHKACLVLEASLTLDITYPAIFTINNKTEIKNKTVRVAVPSNAEVSGDCGHYYYLKNSGGQGNIIKRSLTVLPDEELVTYFSQSLKLKFHINFTEWMVNMQFITPKPGVNQSDKDVVKKYYALHTIQATVNTSAFPDAQNPKIINANQQDETITHRYLQAGFNKSFVCSSETKMDLGSNVILRMYNTKFHPFIPKNFTVPNAGNDSANTTPIDAYFTDIYICTADRLVSDIVPIAVGSALATLILIVLLAYFIGRSRRAASSGLISERGPSFWSRIFRRHGAETPGSYQPID